MIYRAEGHGTKTSYPKKSLVNKLIFLVHLGHGFPVDETAVGETALLVGGGIGVPPLYELSRQLVKKGVTVIHVLGFQT